MGPPHRRHRRTGPDRRRRHPRRRRPGARAHARARRGHRRKDSCAVPASRRGHDGEQRPPGDGPERRDRAGEPKRHGAGAVARARRHGHRVAARAAARDDADVRCGDPRPAGAADRRRGTVSARREGDRARRVRCGRARATRVREVDVTTGSHQHDDSGGARADRAASDGSGAERREAAETGAGRRGPGTAGGAGAVRVQHGWPAARGGGRRAPACAVADRRRGRVVHGRVARVAPHRRTRQFDLCRARRRVLQQQGEDRACRRAGRLSSRSTVR